MKEYRYRVRHLTRYRYSGRIDVCHSVARLTPIEDSSQEILSHRVDISPEPGFVSERRDYFGNGRQYFSIQASHEQLEVTSTFTVSKKVGEAKLPVSGISVGEVSERIPLGGRDEQGSWLGNFLIPSRACRTSDAVLEYVKPSLDPGNDILKLARVLTERIFTEFKYVPGATDNSTPIDIVIRDRVGVCQDFAHVQLACLRHAGIPARYVSGYIETVPPPGQEKLQGADATHAWVEVYSPSSGWVGFDPTNNMLAGHQHIKLAHGRDYFDVQPLKGLFIGSSGQILSVEVDVERI